MSCDCVQVIVPHPRAARGYLCSPATAGALASAVPLKFPVPVAQSQGVCVPTMAKRSVEEDPVLGWMVATKRRVPALTPAPGGDLTGERVFAEVKSLQMTM